MMTTDEIKAKIVKGLELAFTRLIEVKQRNNEDIVISRNGKIVRVKAQEFIQ